MRGAEPEDKAGGCDEEAGFPSAGADQPGGGGSTISGAWPR